jgi:hypothetical protein
LKLQAAIARNEGARSGRTEGGVMDHSTWAGYQHQQQQQQEQARVLELRRSIAERTAVQMPAADAPPAPQPVRDRAWHGLLVRAHLARPIAH